MKFFDERVPVADVAALHALWRADTSADAAVWADVGLPPVDVEFAYVEPDGSWLLGDTREGVLAQVTRAGTGWSIRTWVTPRAGSDPAVTRLALEILAADRPGLAPVTQDTLPSEGGGGVLMWVRAQVANTRLRAAVSSLAAHVPAEFTVERARGGARLHVSGSWDGVPFVFTLRYGTAALRVGGERPDRQPLWIAEEDGDPYDDIDIDALPDLFTRLAAGLTRAPFWYEFPARGVDDENSDAWPIVVGGWGHTVEEARAAAHQHSPWCFLREEPLRADDRQFPQEGPPRFAEIPDLDR